MIKHIYTFFLAVIVTCFIAFGTSLIFPEPQLPKPEQNLDYKNPVVQKRQEDLFKEYEDKRKENDEKNSLVYIVTAIVLMLFSVLSTKKLSFVSDGLLLSSAFLVVIATLRSIGAQSSVLSFTITGIGLALAIVAGYLKFYHLHKN